MSTALEGRIRRVAGIECFTTALARFTETVDGNRIRSPGRRTRVHLMLRNHEQRC
jgi:hypothetical protein